MSSYNRWYVYAHFQLYYVMLCYTEWSKSLCVTDDYSTKNTQYFLHTIDDLNMDITEYILNVYRAILNTVF
jgi:hypothetical protein